MNDITSYNRYGFANNSSTEISRLFRELPKILPNLKQFKFYGSNIPNFENLTAQMPVLARIDFDECHIHNFCGFPLNHFHAENCTIDSFEGIPSFEELPEIRHLFLFKKCKIGSFAGVSRATLQAILIAILSMDYDKYDKNPYTDVRCTLNLAPTALKLYDECIDHEIERRYSPKNQKDWPWFQTDDRPRIPVYFEEEWQLYRDEQEAQATRRQQIASLESSKYNWIYGFNLTDRLFIPEKLDRLYEYYQKTALQLAQNYAANPENLSPELIERLVHEVDPELRKMLENNLPHSNPVIKQISAKFSFKSQNGLKILK